MPVPVAGEHTGRVAGPFRVYELVDAWMGPLELVAPRPAVIGQVVAAPRATARLISPRNASLAGAKPSLRVLDVQVEDDAGPGIACPGEEALVMRSISRTVPYTTSHRTGSTSARLVHEIGEAIARDVDLRDHLAAVTDVSWYPDA